MVVGRPVGNKVVVGVGAARRRSRKCTVGGDNQQSDLHYPNHSMRSEGCIIEGAYYEYRILSNGN